MAVLVQAWEVIARRTAVEEKLRGGIAAWNVITPNQMVCMDRHLCRAGFMHVKDAEAFLASLEALGLRGEEGGAYVEVALFERDTAWRHACKWLVMGRHAGVAAAWLAGADPDPLVVPIGYRPSRGLINLSADEVDRMTFLREEDGVEVYLDTATGTEMYRGRTTTDARVPGDLQQRFERVVNEIEPFLALDGHPKKLGWLARRKLRKGVRALESLAVTDTDLWHVWWFLGMARRSASDPEGAHAAFRRAYHANPEHPDVVREYSGQCLALGKGSEAVALAERNCALSPDDAGVRSNLALALLVAGNVARARKEVARALAMQPGDPITTALEGMIEEVAEGKRERPTRYP